LRTISFPSNTNPQNPEFTITTTARIVVASAPQTCYVTAGIFSGTTGCGKYSTATSATLRCLKTS
jgi:hypothetical protein